MKIIDGKAISTAIREEIAAEVAEMKRKPGLAVVIVGDDPASKVYVRNKHKACEDTGIYSEVHELPASTSQDELLSLVDKLNIDEKINGILVQLPLPKGLSEEEVIARIDPKRRRRFQRCQCRSYHARRSSISPLYTRRSYGAAEAQRN